MCFKCIVSNGNIVGNLAIEIALLGAFSGVAVYSFLKEKREHLCLNEVEENASVLGSYVFGGILAGATICMSAVFVRSMVE